MNTLRCLVVDDEQLARTLLQNYIERLPHLELVQACKRASEAIAVLQEQAIDLVFLDIQMPELTGLQLLQSLAQKPQIIFTTAYQEYALQGYEYNITDYLLKPYGFDRFVQAVNKATAQLRLQQLANKASSQDEAKAHQRDYLLVRADHKMYKIYYADILYIQGMREYVLFFTSKGKIMALQSMKNLESILPPEQFIRIHKSYIVASSHISVFEGNRVQVGEEKLPVGNHYKEQVMSRVFR